MSILFTFPGQGAQRAGMLRALPAAPAVHHTLTEASDTLGRDVLTLDTEKAFESSVAVQIALLVAGVAMGRCLAKLAGPPDAVAGLSVGAYPAAVVAGVVGFADALRLVERRAGLMEAAFPSGYGMTAILGLELSVLEALVAAVHASDSPVYIANVNAPTQLVIAGAHAAMARVASLAQSRGAHGIKPVAINVPSHCPLLDAPAAALALAVAAVPMSAPRLHLFSASLGRELRDPARIADDLAHNMASRVLWHDTTALARERGVRLSIEMPPGNVLTKLAAVALPDTVCVAVSDTRTDTLAVLMKRERERDA
ncbi:MAG: malonate decarboxylase subunit epsilon [Pseudomonadota bacterium]|nr:malonate decarboxylase subunit epsilon [Pseudomonadota bacterium]